MKKADVLHADMSKIPKSDLCFHMLLAKGQTKKPEGSETELLFLAQTSKEGPSFVSMAPHPLSIFFVACVALSQVRGEQVLKGWCQLEAKLQAFWMVLLSQAGMTAGFQSSESRNKSRSVSAKALEAAGGLHVCMCQTARLVITLSHAGRLEMPAKYAKAPHHPLLQS